MLIVQAMINYGLTWNLISQHLMLENRILNNIKVSSGLKTLDENSLQIYQNYSINIQIIDSNREDFTVNQLILRINTKNSIQIIFELS